jgi:hypothetical protein
MVIYADTNSKKKKNTKIVLMHLSNSLLKQQSKKSDYLSQMKILKLGQQSIQMLLLLLKLLQLKRQKNNQQTWNNV